MPATKTRKGPPGIVEVAARAGVSPATVSRFFNTPDVVRGETRKRIAKAAQDLGYIRDRMAGTMHNRFSGTIGLVVPTIDNAIFAELIDAFSRKLRDHDRTMLIAAHGYDLSLEVAIVRSLLERRIDGVALVGFNHESAPLDMLKVRNVPLLAVWNYREDADLACIGANNVDAGQKVVRHVLDHGHSDIALLFPPIGSNDRASDRLFGALSALGKTLESLPPNRLIETPYDIGAAKESVRNLLQSDPPTALVCGNDVIAQGAVYACQSLGWRVPEDISVIGVGDFRGSAEMEPALTTLRLPARRIGEAAADHLCSPAASVSWSRPVKTALPSELIVRGSVAGPSR